MNRNQTDRYAANGIGAHRQRVMARTNDPRTGRSAKDMKKLEKITRNLTRPVSRPVVQAPFSYEDSTAAQTQFAAMLAKQIDLVFFASLFTPGAVQVHDDKLDGLVFAPPREVSGAGYSRKVWSFTCTQR